MKLYRVVIEDDIEPSKFKTLYHAGQAIYIDGRKWIAVRYGYADPLEQRKASENGTTDEPSDDKCWIFTSGRLKESVPEDEAYSDEKFIANTSTRLVRKGKGFEKVTSQVAKEESNAREDWLYMLPNGNYFVVHDGDPLPDELRDVAENERFFQYNKTPFFKGRVYRVPYAYHFPANENTLNSVASNGIRTTKYATDPSQGEQDYSRERRALYDCLAILGNNNGFYRRSEWRKEADRYGLDERTMNRIFDEAVATYTKQGHRTSSAVKDTYHRPHRRYGDARNIRYIRRHS